MSLLFEAPELNFGKKGFDVHTPKGNKLTPRAKPRLTNQNVTQDNKRDENTESRHLMMLKARKRGFHKRTRSDFPVQKMNGGNQRQRSPLVKKLQSDTEDITMNSTKGKKLKIETKVNIPLEVDKKRLSVPAKKRKSQKSPNLRVEIEKLGEARRMSSSSRTPLPLPNFENAKNRQYNMSAVKQYLQKSSMQSPTISPSSISKHSPRSRFTMQRKYLLSNLQMQTTAGPQSFSPPPPDAKLGDYPKPERGMHQGMLKASAQNKAESQNQSIEPKIIHPTITTNHPVTSPLTPASPSPNASPFKLRPKDMKTIQKTYEEELAFQKALSMERTKKQQAPIQVYIYVPIPITEGGGNYGMALNLRKSSTGKMMIKRALMQFKADTGIEPICDEPQGYMLYKAEDDGTIDTDYPSFTKENPMLDLLQITNRFIIAIDTTFKKKKPLEVPTFLQRHINDIYIEVILPDSKSSHCNIVPIAPDVLNRDLMLTICQRFGLDPKLYDMQLIRESNMRYTIPAHLIYKTVRFLDVQKVELFNKYKNNANTITPAATYEKTPSSPQPQQQVIGENFIPLESVAYHEYSVIKINKYNMRQERTLGIDSMYLYNIISKKRPDKVFRFFKKTRPSILQLPLSTLVDVIYDTTAHPKQFTTVFETEKILWEAATQVEASKIVNTLNYLRSLHKTNAFMPGKEIHPQ